MCGLVGLFLDSPREPVRLRAQVGEMSEVLRHRGPDDEGAWVDPSGRLALGFRRLSILDLSPAGHQPMVSRSGRFILVYNGEIYNFESLRGELGRPREAYRGGSDTEVVLEAFDTWGVAETLPRLNGMFAMAVWDAREEELWLARDRMGIKPLYVARTAEGLAVSSELGALMAAPGFDGSLDLQAVEAYLGQLFIPAPDTPFLRAQKVPPGHFLRIRRPEDGLPEAVPYWSLQEARAQGEFQAREDGGRSSLSDAEVVDSFEALLSDAVGLRLVADVPVGALLSGGIDSSLVVALMQRQSSRPARTFTIGFDTPEHDESEHARAVAKHLGTDHTELQVTGADALDLVPRLAEIFDEPLADPSQIPTYLVSRLARRDVTVALSGDGGDELFAGYNRYLSGPSAAARILQVPAIPRRWMGRALQLLPARTYDGMASLSRGSGVFPRLVGQKVHKLARMMQASTPDEFSGILHTVWDEPGRFISGGSFGPMRGTVGSHPVGGDSLDVGEMLFQDQSRYLPDDLLQKVDRASMAVSLEVRVPILDHRVVERSWQLPHRYKVRDGQGKWILRQVLYRHVPPSLLDRPKVGFSVPVESWLAGPLKEWAEDLLLAPSPTRDALLNAREIRRAWRGFLRGRSELALGLWSLAMFEAWRTRWKIENLTQGSYANSERR